MDMEADYSSGLTTPLSSPAESELDFGAFEIMSDSGVTAVDVITKDEPLIYHENLPVHSVHHQTVKTETAVQSLLTCPDSVLTRELPPVVVGDNYCFVVDGSKIRTEDINADDQWWRHTSRPTKYYFSDDLRRFIKVNVVQVKGKIISAKFPKTKMQSLNLPQSGPGHGNLSHSPSSSSIIGNNNNQGPISPPPASPGPSLSPRGTSGEEVNLANVFKVIRFYSFWKTCTSFHRIVTLVMPAVEHGANPVLKKRLFVQFLWRNAKDTDKARVAKEFDHKQQRLFTHVKDPDAKKRIFKNL